MWSAGHKAGETDPGALGVAWTARATYSSPLVLALSSLSLRMRTNLALVFSVTQEDGGCMVVYFS